jgi:hypothetical protein
MKLSFFVALVATLSHGAVMVDAVSAIAMALSNRAVDCYSKLETQILLQQRCANTKTNNGNPLGHHIRFGYSNTTIKRFFCC